LALDDGQNALNLIDAYLKKSPTVERVYRLKMEAHYAARDEQNIFQTYEVCKDMLQTKLNSDPSVETDQLLEKLSKMVASRPAVERVSSKRPKSKTLSVLPFVNMSADPENEYFSDGLTEELISAFTKIPGLRVTSRTSAFAFKNTGESIRHIGEQLGVTTVLEGSVRKSDNRLRITAQLINVEDDYHLWSDRFDRPFEDVFDIQDEISVAIVDGLKVELAGEQEAVFTPPTDNLDAYTHYLQGRFHWNKRTENCLKESITCFEKAIDIDPNYALAFAGIADSYNALALLEFMAPKDAFPKAREAVDSALALNESSPEAQTALGWIHFIYDWDWPNAEIAFKKALKINQNYPVAHHYYADLLKAMGRFDEAIAEIETAQRRDPLSLPINTGVGHVLYLAQRYDDAIEQYRKTLKIDPNFVPTRLWFGRPYLQKGMFSEAIAEVQQAVDLSGGSSVALATLGHVYAVAGQTEEAHKLLDQLLTLSEKHYVPSYWVAMIYIGLEDMDKAFEWFNKAADERSSWLAWVQVEPRFDQLRLDSRYKALLNKMGFSQ
jgi:TolB-like protein